MTLPRIRYIAFGGTISSKPLGTDEHVAPQLDAAEILASVPELAKVARIEGSDLAALPSNAVTPDHMLTLADGAASALAGGCEGVVITHGTDTIEETAYALALMLPRKVPVVLTGAMRHASQTGSEGPANLLAAFRVAANPQAAGLGPVVVFNDEIHAARFVTKLHTSKPSTFTSPGAGPIGEIVEERVDIWWAPAWIDEIGRPNTLGGIRVELVRVAAGISDAVLRAAAITQPSAIVIEGTGGGHVPPPLLPALDEIISAGIPVAIASRAIAGPTLEGTYGVPGAEIDLIDRGAIPVGRLTGHKARLRLLIGGSLGIVPSDLLPVR